jgi:Resolvase, N terminal domain
LHNEDIKYGYARVWTDDQTPALQLAALKKAGCKTVFKDDGISGATTKRPALLRCLKKLEPGDILIVWKLDRLYPIPYVGCGVKILRRRTAPLHTPANHLMTV